MAARNKEGSACFHPPFQPWSIDRRNGDGDAAVGLEAGAQLGGGTLPFTLFDLLSQTTSGRGLAEQVKQCEGERSTPELRACLKPNRRVAITITPVD